MRELFTTLESVRQCSRVGQCDSINVATICVFGGWYCDGKFKYFSNGYNGTPSIFRERQIYGITRMKVTCFPPNSVLYIFMEREEGPGGGGLDCSDKKSAEICVKSNKFGVSRQMRFI